VTLTGMAIAAASYYFSSIINAPTPEVYPVVGRNGIVAAIAIWMLTGPIAVGRFGISLYTRRQYSASFSLLAIIASLLWAFCLGVLALELVFQLFLA